MGRCMYHHYVVVIHPNYLMVVVVVDVVLGVMLMLMVMVMLLFVNIGWLSQLFKL